MIPHIEPDVATRPERAEETFLDSGILLKARFLELGGGGRLTDDARVDKLLPVGFHVIDIAGRLLVTSQNDIASARSGDIRRRTVDALRLRVV